MDATLRLVKTARAWCCPLVAPHSGGGHAFRWHRIQVARRPEPGGTAFRRRRTRRRRRQTCRTHAARHSGRAASLPEVLHRGYEVLGRPRHTAADLFAVVVPEPAR